MDRTLLIVDDEVDLLELLVEIAQPVATKILTAPNGEEALKLVRAQNPQAPIDAILSDINMPIKSGIQLLKDLRAEGCYTPFIFLTGYGDRDKMSKAIKFGAFDFFDKPANNRQLVARLDEALALGVHLRTLNQELDLLTESQPDLASMSPEERQKWREATAEVLMVRKLRLANLKPTG